MHPRTPPSSLEISADCPCTGHCSTVLGDEVCRSCLRTFDEVTRWPQMNEEERRAVNRRIVLEQWESFDTPKVRATQDERPSTKL